MSIRWKLIRETLDKKQYQLPCGECTIGRSLQSTISLPSTIISRQHCTIHVEGNKVMIIDLQSSNGTYVNDKKIKCNTKVELKESAIIGIGWNTEQQDIPENDKFIFKLVKENIKYLSSDSNNIFHASDTLTKKLHENENQCESKRISAISDLQLYSNENLKNIEMYSESKSIIKQEEADNLHCSLKSVKNKSNENNEYSLIRFNNDNSIININQVKKNKIKFDLGDKSEDLEQHKERNLKRPYCVNIKQEKAIVPSKKQCVNEVLIDLVSDSDDDVSFEPNISTNVKLKIEPNEDSAHCITSIPIEDANAIYDNVKQELDSEAITIDSDDSCDADLWLSRLSQSQCSEVCDEEPINAHTTNIIRNDTHPDEKQSLFSDIIISPLKPVITQADNSISSCIANNENSKATPETSACLDPSDKRNHKNKAIRKTKLIDVIAHNTKPSYKEPKKKSSRRSSKRSTECIKKTSNNEERKKRLHEIATKNKAESTEHTVTTVCSTNDSSKQKLNVKITAVNRSAFLTEKNESKPSTKAKNRKAPIKTSVKTARNETDSKKDPVKINVETTIRDYENITKASSNHIKPAIKAASLDKSKPKKKNVRFSTVKPKVIEFQIEPGNKLINVVYAKPHYEYSIDRGRHSSSIISLDRQYIMRILKWNTNWLKEKVLINNNQLPDLTGGNVVPSHIFHNFSNHGEYIKQIGHLLLIDIWDTLATEHGATSNQENMMEFRIESISPQYKPSDSHVTICVNLSLPKKFVKDVPKQRDLMILTMRPGVSKFFYVHEITPLSTPSNNLNNFYSIQLHTTHSEKLVNLQRGEVVHGKKLINMNSYIILFQAIQCLATSPLCEVVLHPQPHHFIFTNVEQSNGETSKWTNSCNISQLKAVDTIVMAALSNKPSIHMVQGPPGTGKSRVICSIVMQYFYGNSDKRLRDRGKILICATSNAAVDGLVNRLLTIRQTLPQHERFRMVRVGRDEVMHETARSVSLKSLTERTVATQRARPNDSCLNNNITAEMNCLTTKENMWRSALATTEDPARRAYCQSRLEPIIRRQQQLKTASETGCMQQSLMACEQQIVQKADIVATTLTSVANYRMLWLKGLVTLCIVDEAGQAIEPVSLIPLTLGVTRLALIGDPQQLPGFTRSEAAKKYGLGESLFSRLSSCGMTWPDGGPTMLLNVQYRMHPEIADYPNRAFYASKIQNMYTPCCDINLPPYKVLFIKSSESEHGSTQTVNEKEAWAVTRLVTSLYYMLQPKKMSLAVITPYVAQKELIKHKLRITMEVEGEPPVEVNTVDSFQGQERDVVLVSLVRRHGVGFLYDTGRMNVMLTRAKHSLLICIDPNALQDNMQWKTLIDDAKKRKLYKYLPEHLCKSATSQKAQVEDVLHYLRK